MLHVLSSQGFPPVAEPWASVLIGLIAVVVIAWITVVVRVLMSIIRSPMDGGMKIVWVALIMYSQPLGVLLWLTIGRKRMNHLAM